MTPEDHEVRITRVGPRLARVLQTTGELIVLSGFLLGVPLGVFGGLIGSADSVGVSIPAGVTFGLLMFAAPPILVGMILLGASSVVRKRATTPSS